MSNTEKLEINKFDKKAYYEGETLNGVPHGKGKCQWDAWEWDDTVYEGEWVDGKMHGKGIFRTGRSMHFPPHDRGWVYEGEFVNDAIEGYGVMESKRNWRYEGEFKNWYKHGKGVYTDDDGSVWKGTWVEGRQNGYGTCDSADGWTYEGDLENGKFEGQGIQKGDGWTYEGGFKWGKRGGYGVYKTDVGEIYEGEWSLGGMCGKCHYTSPCGWSFDGVWENYLGKGDGKMVFENGDTYEGQVGTDDSLITGMTMHGKGVYKNIEGYVYDGEFNKGEPWGHGILTGPDGMRVEGRFEGENLISDEEMEQRRIAFRKSLEEKCKALYGSETDIRKRYSILKEAYFQSHNSGFNDHMAWEAASGRDDYEIRFWDQACKLKKEVSWLCDIYKEELGEEE